MLHRFRFSWTGAAILVLALALGGGWATGFIASAISPVQVSTEGISMLDSLGSGIVAVIGMAVGYRFGAAKNTDET